MNKNHIAAGFGSFLGGLLWGTAFSQGIRLVPFFEEGQLLSWGCPFICGIVCFVYLTVLRSSNYDEDEEVELLSSFLGEAVSALPISLICWGVVVLIYFFCSQIIL